MEDPLRDRFASLTTAHVADGCVRAGVTVRSAPALVRPVAPEARLAGRAVPVQHVGSVDIFLEALEAASPGNVLVVDNGGRLDEACIGDLVVLEVQATGLQGIVIWGLHRDTAEVRAIGLPVFSLGAIPTGPQRLDARPADALQYARLGACTVSREDVVMADEDGVLVVPAVRAEEVCSLAETIRDTEHRQAELMRAGTSLRRQLRFETYLTRRRATPSLSFRDYLRDVGGAIEE